MSKNTTNNIELWNAIISLNPAQRAQMLSIAQGMSAEADNSVVEIVDNVIGLAMTKKVAPTVFSAIHHACKDGGATWDKSLKMWVFESAKARDKVLRAQKKYAKEHGFECVLEAR